MLKFTTSWDDGDVLDVRLAALLDRYGIKGTFYVSKKYRHHRLSDDAIRALATRQEIGAHTLSHPDLRKLSHQEKHKEIVGSKKWLETLLGKPVPMFCYPSGRFDDASAHIVHEAGFIGARTTVGGHLIVQDSYRMPTTLQVYPFPFRKNASGGYYWGRLLQPFFERYRVYRALGVPLWRMISWKSVARTAFDHARKHGEIFHLWGHSWEIEKYGMWDELEQFLAYCNHKGGYMPVVNSDVLQK